MCAALLQLVVCWSRSDYAQPGAPLKGETAVQKAAREHESIRKREETLKMLKVISKLLMELPTSRAAEFEADSIAGKSHTC